MVNIPIRDIPGGIATPNGQALLAMDNGISVLKTTVSQVVLAGRPTATQQEAIDGADNLKAMTPLTVAQAIEALAIPKGVETEIYDAAETATNAAQAASASAGTASGAAGTAQTSAGQAMAFRNQTQTIADQFGDLSSAVDQIDNSVTAAQSARDAAVSAAGTVGNYDTLAQANAALASIPANGGVNILADGANNGFYVKQGTVLVRKSLATLPGLNESKVDRTVVDETTGSLAPTIAKLKSKLGFIYASLSSDGSIFSRYLRVNAGDDGLKVKVGNRIAFQVDGEGVYVHGYARKAALDALADEVAGIEISGAQAVIPTPKAPLPESLRFVLSSTSTYGIVAYGQSLSLGATGQPPLSISQPYANKTFSAGPKTTLTGNAFGGTNQSAMDASKPLIEDTLTGDGTSGRGETILSGMLNGACELAAIEGGRSPNSIVMFGSTAGRGGTGIVTLSKGQAWYQNFIDHVTRQNAVEVAAGRPYVLSAIPWLQAENNATMSRSQYRGLAETLFNDMQNDAMAITGQTVRPHIIVYQTQNGITSGGGPALALLDLANEREDVHMAGPNFFMPFSSDGIHLNNVGYRWYGAYFARALKDILVDAKRPMHIRCLSATARGRVVRLKFQVPTLPLRIDREAFYPTAQDGFHVPDRTVQSVVTADDEVMLTLNTAPAAGSVVRYGLDFVAPQWGNGPEASGNLRDSTPGTTSIQGTDRPMFQVCPSFEMSILILENGV